MRPPARAGVLHGRHDRRGLRKGQEGLKDSPPKRLRRLPLKGATPAARQSRFCGVPRRSWIQEN
ncbi:hypothetical protein EEB15_04460 [Ramlibacter sp. WS9]|nr:hypothetical protein EEB15_04460 [Ramlibacter sp. WS9]